MSEDFIPLAGDEPEPVYNKPEKVSSTYTAFVTKYGDPTNLAAMDDATLSACAHEVLVLRGYIEDKYGKPLAEIEAASKAAQDAKQKLQLAAKYSRENFPGPKTSPMTHVASVLRARSSGANAEQLRAISIAIVSELSNALSNGDKTLNPPSGANDFEKSSKCSVVVGLLNEFVKSNVAAIVACTAETFTKMGYREPNVDRAQDCVSRAETFDKLCVKSKNAYGWHNQEVAFYIKKIAETVKSRESVMMSLDRSVKLALGLETESKIRHSTGNTKPIEISAPTFPGLANTKKTGTGWTPGPPTGFKGPSKDDGQGPIDLAGDEKGSR